MNKRHYLFLLSVLGLGALAACGRSALVLRTHPGDGEVVAATGRVGVEFAVIMDEESAESSFFIEPNLEGTYFWEDNIMWFIPEVPLAPEKTYTATLEGRAASQAGRRLDQTLSWQFTIREPAIVFLSQIEGVIGFWQKQNAGSTRLSPEFEGEILSYAFDSAGNEIIYVVTNAAGGRDLWWSNRLGSSFRMLVDCGADRCTEPAWSPDAQRIAYNRAQAIPAAVNKFDPARLWTLNPVTGQTSALLQDDHELIGGPIWSPDGDKLAFYDTLVNGIRILDLVGGADSVLPSGYGIIGSWSPEGERMVFPVLQGRADGFSVSIRLASLKSKETTVIMDENAQWLDIGLPAWSPDGQWIVIAIQSAEYGLGKQLWLMNSDGSGLHLIVIDPAFSHGGYRWDPYSEKIIFQRFNLGDPDATPEVWVWSMEDEQVQSIAQNAWQPDWLP